MFNSLNQSLFTLINAPATAGSQMIFIATLAAEWLLYLLALLMVLGWLRGGEHLRRLLFQAGLAALTGLVINQIIRSFFIYPRPFAAGFGQQFLAHAPDASFPSDHGTIMFSIALALLLAKGGRGVGFVVLLMALATAWGRIYLGVHWPLDMLGSGAVALISAVLVTRFWPRPTGALFDYTLRLYRWLLAVLHLPASIFPR